MRKKFSTKTTRSRQHVDTHHQAVMDAFSDSGELYTIRNQFYTNQHNKVKAYSLDEFSPENQLKVLEFQIRSTIALEQDASKMIEDGKTRFPENEPLFQLLSAWNDLKDFGVDDSTYFEDVKKASFELQAVLTALYLVKFDKDIDQAITFLSDYIDNVNSLAKYNELEPFLVLVQLYLIKGNLTGATKVLQNLNQFPESARDNIVYQVLESWILSVTGGSDNINNSYYFYDEILSSDFDQDIQGKFKILNVLFALTLQLKHFPEAQELLEQIKGLGVVDANFIANQITFDQLQNDGANTAELLNELKRLDASHELLKEQDLKTSIFDDIVTKYSI